MTTTSTTMTTTTTTMTTTPTTMTTTSTTMTTTSTTMTTTGDCWKQVEKCPSISSKQDCISSYTQYSRPSGHKRPPWLYQVCKWKNGKCEIKRCKISNPLETHLCPGWSVRKPTPCTTTTTPTTITATSTTMTSTSTTLTSTTTPMTTTSTTMTTTGDCWKQVE